LRNAPRASGLEPDECFIIGSDQSAERPDLAIEVHWTHWTNAGLDKLEIYRRLGVPEVWIWRDDAISVHVLSGDAYTRSDHSRQLPGIDLNLLTSLLDYPTVLQAVRALRKALAG
jgi:Uma2 family endonuclease